MKRFFNFALVLAAISFAACTNDLTEDQGFAPNVGGGIMLSVELPNPEVRTALGEKDATGKYPVVWSANDVVSINGVAASVTIDDSSASVAHFTAEEAEAYNIVYPYTDAVAEGEGKLAVEFAAVQPHTEGSFSPNSFPMYASSAETSLSMQYLAGVLRFAIVGDAGIKLSSIGVSAEENIAGKFDLDVTTGALVAHAAEGAATNAVTYTFAEPYALNPSTASVFYITVPAGEYGIFTARFNAETGECFTVKFASEDDAAIKAGTVREFKQVTFEDNKDAFSEFLIYTEADLQRFAMLVNKNVFDYPSVRLCADIAVQNPETLDVISEFKASFDGAKSATQNYKISGLTKPLFGTISEGTVQNLDIEANIEITTDEEGRYVGVLAQSLNRGVTIDNVNTSGSIIFNNAVTDAPTEASGYVAVGGLAGTVSGCVVKNCTNSASVHIKNMGTWGKLNAHIGGIGGYSTVGLATVTEKYFENCSNSGDITWEFGRTVSAVYLGGVVSRGYLKVKDCENSGNITVDVKELNNLYIGGVMARYEQDATALNTLDITGSNNSGDITVGEVTITGSVYLAGVLGNWVYSAGKFENNKNSGKINSKAKVGEVYYIGGISGYVYTSHINCDNLVGGDITIAGEMGATKDSTGSNPLSVGGVAGRGRGSFTNCDNAGNVTISTKMVAGAAPCHIGGMLGYFGNCPTDGSTVSGCTNTGAVLSSSEFSYAAKAMIGGVVGNVHSTAGLCVKDCTNGSEEDPSLGSVKFTGKTTTTTYVAGIIGYSANSDRVFSGLTNYGTIENAAQQSGPIMAAGIISSSPSIKTTEAHTNLKNYGSVTISGSGTNAYIAGIFAYPREKTETADHKGYMTNIENHGAVKFSGTATSTMYIGGCVGIAEDKNTTASTAWTNNGKVEIASSAKVAGVYMGGVAGRTKWKVNTLANTADVVFAGTSTGTVYMSGLSSYHSDAQVTASTNGGADLDTKVEFTGKCATLYLAGCVAAGGQYFTKYTNYADIIHKGETTKLAYVGGVGAEVSVGQGLINHGDITVATKDQNPIYIGGLSAFTKWGTYETTGQSNANKGTISYTINGTQQFFVGGIAGAQSHANDTSGTDTLCKTRNAVNDGDIEIIGTPQHYTGSSLAGFAKYENRCAVGGVIGKFYATNPTKVTKYDITQTAKNNGKISISDAASINYLAVGGLIGEITADKTVNLSAINTGDIELTTTGGGYGLFVGGAIGLIYDVQNTDSTSSIILTEPTDAAINSGTIMLNEDSMDGVLQAYLGGLIGGHASNDKHVVTISGCTKAKVTPERTSGTEGISDTIAYTGAF